MGRRARTARLLGAGLLAAALAAGCGFRPAGSAAHLPPAMKTTYIASSQPYGNLENLLRRAIRGSGCRVVNDEGKAGAVLTVMSERQERRVLAVDAQGHPKEFGLTYTVQYRLDGSDGRPLLAPSKVELRRDLAYSVNIELGAGRRQQQLESDMQREATRLILLRLEALARHPQAPKPGSVPAPAAAT